jgi:hypothetical protein
MTSRTPKSSWLVCVPQRTAGEKRSRLNPTWVPIDDTPPTFPRSGLVKVTGNYSDLFWGHSAWFIYQVPPDQCGGASRAPASYPRWRPHFFQGTNRIFKSYDFSGLANSAALGRVMSFSSCERRSQGESRRMRCTRCVFSCRPRLPVVSRRLLQRVFYWTCE